jgi:hypothetical protein
MKVVEMKERKETKPYKGPPKGLPVRSDSSASGGKEGDWRNRRSADTPVRNQLMAVFQSVGHAIKTGARFLGELCQSL